MPDPTSFISDGQLLADYAGQHSERAFAALVERYMPLVLSVCRRVLEDEHAARDAAQAVFLALARKAAVLKRDQPLGGWLHHVALCTARNERTARERRARREQEAAAMHHEPTDLSPETAADLQAWVDRELDALPSKYRDSLVLVHLEGRSLEDAAQALRCKSGTLRVWLSRAREKLRARLLRRGIGVSAPALAAWLASAAESSAAGTSPEWNALATNSAIAWISGGSAAAGVAPKIIVLAKATLHSLFMSKLKTAAVFTAAVAVVSTASAWSWQKVYEARDKGLPKTAIEELKPIIVDALQNRKHAEAIKAICLKITFEGRVEGNKPEEKITRLQAELDAATPEMKPLMEAVLAHWYWQYFQQNRHRFVQRTRTAAASGGDFTTWDLPRLLAEVDAHFSAALANEKLLQSTPVAHFDDLLEKGNTPDALRPTLYDFLAHEALQFYQAGEQGLPKAEDAFEITADGPVFAPVGEFLAWQPGTTDEGSPLLRAMRLFQKLLAFHQNDVDKAALWDADLWRLLMGKNQAVGADKGAKFKEALDRLSREAAGSEVASRALHEWAAELLAEGQALEAHGTAKRGAALFPDSYGARACRNVVAQIEARSVNISTERVWNEPWPVIAVDYRNVTKAHFRAYAQDFEAFLTAESGMGMSEDKIDALLSGRAAGNPAAAWEADLPPTADYQNRVEKVPVPKNLKPGFYHIVASQDAGFAKGENQVAWTTVWVSDLALVTRPGAARAVEGFVLQARSGEPVTGARVRPFVQRFQQNRVVWNPETEIQTDANGLFVYQARGKQMHEVPLFVVDAGGMRLASEPDVGVGFGDQGPQRALEQTVFFTDRALYRPGQIVQYKGLCFSASTGNDRYGVIGGRNLEVVFRDANHREIARQKHTTNDYGSFSGSFNAPGGTVSGAMVLQVEKGPHGSAQVQVEEYKRPKFQVELLAPKEGATLGAEVRLAGRASAYSGAAVGGAKVAWRVVREVEFPRWCWWGMVGFEGGPGMDFHAGGPRGGRAVFGKGPRPGWSPPGPGNRASAHIARGVATTTADGGFEIQFKALPDRVVPEKNEPIFTYRVYADVTDTTGETRSGSRSVRAGYTALTANVDAEEWQEVQKPVRLTVETSSIDGAPQAARGTLKIHALKQPDAVVRAELQPGGFPVPFPRGGRGGADGAKPPQDPANPDSWEPGEVVAEKAFETDGGGRLEWETPLKAGVYRAMLQTTDRFGKTVTARHTLHVLDPKANRFSVRVADHWGAEKWSVEPGQTFRALWGTGYEKGRAFVEVLHRHKKLRAYWTDAEHTQHVLSQAVGEEMRGGFGVRVTFFRENRAYLHEHVVDVPWSNQKLSVRWERLVSKLEPGKKETWTAVVSGPDAKSAVAECVATLYDASLDQYKPHSWREWLDVFRREQAPASGHSANHGQPFQALWNGWVVPMEPASLEYRHYPADILQQSWHEMLFLRKAQRAMNGMVAPMPAAAPMAAAMEMDAAPRALNRAELQRADYAGGNALALAAVDKQQADRAPERAKSADEARPALLDPDKITARKNLNELAFFLPKLVSDAQGMVRMEFTMPEALTEWKFMAFAHDKQLRSGFLSGKAMTSKDVMVEPNPPRFVREGDELEFTVKVSNQSPTRQAGRVRLTFADARTLGNRDAQLENKAGEQAFDLPSHQAVSLSWRIRVPDGADALTYKAVAATERMSDGEEGMLPVLSRRIPVIESLAIPLRGAQTKTFNLEKLLQSGSSTTLKHQNLTVQMVSQPAWYAVMALPYLMETGHESSEAVFNRFYANSLGRHIAESDPKIRRVFEQWRNTPALESPLEKNPELKAVLLEETPWLRQGLSESEARRNVGVLFDGNRLEIETREAFAKLAKLQRQDGLWSWFPGALRGDPYMSLYIATGFGRLRHLGVAQVELAPALKAWAGIDAWMDEQYRLWRKGSASAKLEDYVPSALDALYLYGRSFFLRDVPVSPKHQEMVDFLMRQARAHWLKAGNRQTQGHLALGLKRLGDAETPGAILKSLKEHSVRNDEMGLFWRDTELSWSWFRAPIETQAVMIEALDEVAADAEAVEDAKVWLLKQKQTQDWKTTKATADAVYALLLRGTKLLGSDALVEVELGGEQVKPEKVEAGTGFYEHKLFRGEIRPGMGKITVRKTDTGVGWGSLHWQYLEDMAKVTPHAGTPLFLQKTLYRRENTKRGPELKLVEGALAVGDELVCRVEVRADRDMEYVHLKDQRGSGTEPVNVLSHNKMQDGLAYYESTRDTASHFFIHYLPKGTYVFEYPVRIQHRGKYQSGIASIQCMYAPEFNAHSRSVALEVW